MDRFEKTTNRYAVCRGLSRRARHLYDGVPPLVEAPSLKPCKNAVLEHEAGLHEFYIHRPGLFLAVDNTTAPQETAAESEAESIALAQAG